MNFEGKTWLKAGLLGAGVDVGYSVLTTILSIIPFLVCINCLLLPLTCILWIVLPMGTGYMAAKWANIKNGETEVALKEGALAGLVLGLVSGLINLVLQLVMSVFNVTMSTSLNSLTENNDYGTDLSFLPVTAGGVLVCGLFALALGVVFDVIFSVLGGIIYSSTTKE